MKDFSQLPKVFIVLSEAHFRELHSGNESLTAAHKVLGKMSLTNCALEGSLTKETFTTNVKTNLNRISALFLLSFSDCFLENHNFWVRTLKKIGSLAGKAVMMKNTQAHVWISVHFPGLISHAVCWNANYHSSIAFIFPLLAHFLVNIKRPIMRPTSLRNKQIEHRGVKWHLGSLWASCQIWNQIFLSWYFSFKADLGEFYFQETFYKELMFDKTDCMLAWSRNISHISDLRIKTELGTQFLNPFNKILRPFPLFWGLN